MTSPDKTADPLRSFGFVLQDVARLMRRNFNRRVQALGLTQAQWQALVQISRNEGMSQAALADLLEVHPISVARLIDRMESAGWVERRRDPADRRALCLHLTPKAAPILHDMWALAAETRAEATAGLSEDDRARLLAILLHMRGNLAAPDTQAAAPPPGEAPPRGPDA